MTQHTATADVLLLYEPVNGTASSSDVGQTEGETAGNWVRVTAGGSIWNVTFGRRLVECLASE